MTVLDHVPAADHVEPRRWRVWGTSVVVAASLAADVDVACALVREELDAFDRACNRFCDHSELSALNCRPDEAVVVSPLLMEAVETSLRAAAVTDGAVVPTIGRPLIDLGYDVDFDEVRHRPPGQPLGAPPTGVAPWESVVVDRSAATVTVPSGALLDLGATAKALCVDRAARRAAEVIGAGVLVDIGGDVAVAGRAPRNGWSVGVVDDVRRATPLSCVVAIEGGGLATSGTTARSWSRGGRSFHHIIDPATGWPAEPVWRLVTVAAASCVDANTASTAAVVWGEEAPFRLAQMGLPARLVRADGRVERVGGWPEDRGGRHS